MSAQPTQMLETLEQSLEWYDENLRNSTGSYAVDKGVTDAGVMAEWLNRDFFDGVLRGVANPKVNRDGMVLDETKRRPYTRDEVQLLLTLPSVVTYIAELRREREIERKQDSHQARVEQLAMARLIKAARAERERNPLLYRQIEALVPVIEWLVERSFDKCPYDVERVLPELPEE